MNCSQFNMHTLKSIFCLLLILSILPGDLRAQAEKLSANVDRNSIAIDESFSLTLRYEGQTSSSPDLKVLNENFEILGTNQSSQVQITNNQRSSFTEWFVTLHPKKEGKIRIPSISVGKAVSDPIEITVSQPAPPPPGELQDIFLETIVDKSNAYVQEQVKVTYRLYFSIKVESLNADELEIDNTIIESLPEAIYNRTVSGKSYRVAEYTHTIFPQSSGELIIPILNWRVGIRVSAGRTDFFGRPMGRTQIKRLRSQEKLVRVKGKPDSFPSDAAWLPANDLQVSETWSSETFNLGEPVTLNLTTIAKGLMTSQLPEFLNKNIDTEKIRLYADQPQSVDDKNSDGITAKRIESAAIVISTPGVATIPAIRIPWWDVEDDTLKYAEIPQKLVRVAGDQNDATSPDSIATSNLTQSNTSTLVDNASNNTTVATLEKRLRYYQYGILALLFSTAFLAWGWLRKPGSTPGDTDAHRQQNIAALSFRELKKACQNNRLSDARRQLIAWASQQWPMLKITTLQELAMSVEDQELKKEIKNLDRILYGKISSNESWAGTALLAALKKELNSVKHQKKLDTLSPLYP